MCLNITNWAEHVNCLRLPDCYEVVRNIGRNEIRVTRFYLIGLVANVYSEPSLKNIPELFLWMMGQRHFGPIRDRYDHFEQHPDEVEEVLQQGAKTARAVVRDVTDRARAACGVG